MSTKAGPTGAETLVNSLAAEGVDTIFGLPGLQLDYIFDALYDRQDTIRVIHTRHEQATAYMAFGYAQASGRIGTCLVVPGPGVLNATAALSTAYACNAPVLCITGQIPSAHIGGGLGFLHEIPDQTGLLASVSKWQGLVKSPAHAADVVHAAFRELNSGRRRPVVIEIPPDVAAERSPEIPLGPPTQPVPPPQPRPRRHCACRRTARPRPQPGDLRRQRRVRRRERAAPTRRDAASARDHERARSRRARHPSSARANHASRQRPLARAST